VLRPTRGRKQDPFTRTQTMKRWKKYAAGLLLTAGLSSQVHAQGVAVPGAAAPAAAPAAAVPPTAAAPAAAPGNLWSFICLTPEQKAACIQKICNCPLGQMLNNGLKPMSAMSGGLIPTFCPAISPADLAKPADSAEGAAARAKADEADAKARREAVRFLGTVDCHYWPEAQEALINALRGDRNECVRLEAAFALNRGCCCTKIIIKALVNCVSGTDEDGFPGERSERVRATAHAALVHCLACYTEVVPVPPPPPPEIKDKGKEPLPPREPLPVPSPGTARPSETLEKPAAHLTEETTTPAEYYHRVQGWSREKIIADGRSVLARLQTVAEKPQVVTEPAESQPKSFVDLFQHAFGVPTTTVTTIAENTAPPADALPVKAAATTVTLDPVPTKTTIVSPPATPQAMPPVQTVQSMDRAPQLRSVPNTVSNNTGMNMTMEQVVSVLRESPYPEYRGWAAENLATVDGWNNPAVVTALATAARTDYSATVRANCVRSLGRMRYSTREVLTAVQSAKSDPDLHVRQEADLALQLIGGVESSSLRLP
jgi:hypothetical protein